MIAELMKIAGFIVFIFGMCVIAFWLIVWAINGDGFFNGNDLNKEK